MEFSDGEKQHVLKGADVTDKKPLPFPLARTVAIQGKTGPLEKGKHEIEIAVEATPFGTLAFKVNDAIEEKKDRPVSVPYNKEDNYSHKIVRQRLRFLEDFAGVKPKHLTQASFDPSITQGNIENFVGVAQVPIGLAGPLKVNASTRRGTSVPSPPPRGRWSPPPAASRCQPVGRRHLHVVLHAMQRARCNLRLGALGAGFSVGPPAPAADRRACRYHLARRQAAAHRIYLASISPTSLQLLHRDGAGRHCWARHLHACVDPRAVKTSAASTLSPNLSTYRMPRRSHLNTRGKRVSPRPPSRARRCAQNMRVDPGRCTTTPASPTSAPFCQRRQQQRRPLAHAIPRCHRTGQAAHVSSRRRDAYTEVKRGRPHISITLPSLIIATPAAASALPTQRDAWRSGFGLQGQGQKLAEIIAVTVLPATVAGRAITRRLGV